METPNAAHAMRSCGPGVDWLPRPVKKTHLEDEQPNKGDILEQEQ